MLICGLLCGQLDLDGGSLIRDAVDHQFCFHFLQSISAQVKAQTDAPIAISQIAGSQGTNASTQGLYFPLAHANSVICDADLNTGLRVCDSQGYLSVFRSKILLRC
jgi:predicted signal transduction protein with EAL and GGDEF domain